MPPVMAVVTPWMLSVFDSARHALGRLRLNGNPNRRILPEHVSIIVVVLPVLGNAHGGLARRNGLPNRQESDAAEIRGNG